MKLTALATMKIEGDIIEEFVRHTLRFVDRLIIVDNGSLDAAREILTELTSEGLPVSIWDGEPFPSHGQGWTAFARRAFASFETEYLLMLDIDEFVRAPSRAALEEALEALDGAHGVVPWLTYVPTRHDDPDEIRVLARVRHRLHHEFRSFSKVFVHHSFMDDAGASIAQGNHAVVHADGDVLSRTIIGIELAHIPVRSLQQLQSKAILGWPTFLTMGFDEQHDIAYQWRRLNERLLREPHWNANDFFDFAWRYLVEDEDVEPPEFVLDPLPTVECRYHNSAPELLALAMAFTRQLARVYGARTHHLEGNPVTMALEAPSDNHQDNTSEGLEVYGEGYFQWYHTGLGPMAYERSPHWLSFFATVADEIIRIFRPHTLLDAGCALGILVESLWDRGVKAQGIDVSSYAIEHVRPDMRSHCRRASLTHPIEGSFDMVTCIEVLEHLDAADAQTAIANICNVTDTVLFSSTPSDFSEPTHINVCPPIIWIELFAAHGFGPDLLCDVTFLAPHAMVFRRGNPCDTTVLETYALLNRYRTLCSERLEAIALERNNAVAAEQARADAHLVLEQRCADALEAQRNAELQTSVVRAEYHALQATLAAHQLAEAEAGLQARTRAEAYTTLEAEVLRYRQETHSLRLLLDNIRHSNSWRLTFPLRSAAIFVRTKLKRITRRGD